MRRLKSAEFETTLTLKGEEVDVAVTYCFTPATPDVFYTRNGDPGDPGDPAEAEVEAVHLIVGKGRGRDVLAELDEATVEGLCEKACEEGEEALERRYEDAMEDKADAARDGG